MRLEYYNKKKLKKELLDSIGKHLDLSQYKVFFFGSRVTNRGDNRSDIDIGIEGQKKIASKIIGKIREEIDDIPTLYKIDVVDFRDVAPSFYEVAKQNVEYLNK